MYKNECFDIVVLGVYLIIVYYLTESKIFFYGKVYIPPSMFLKCLHRHLCKVQLMLKNQECCEWNVKLQLCNTV